MILFIIFTAIVAVSCSSITIKTLVGYSDVSFVTKALVTIFITSCWFSPIFSMSLRKAFTNVPFIITTSQILYLFFGFAFILFAIIIARDICWYIGYYLNKFPDPRNVYWLNRANVVVIIFSILIASYSFYEGVKEPRIKEVDIYSDKISKEFKIVLITDLHINQGTTKDRLHSLVKHVDDLSPDVVLFAGDTIDDIVSVLGNKIDILKDFKTKNGIFLSLGNHELYNGLNDWKIKFSSMGEGLKLLDNSGVELEGNNVYILGIPDTRIFSVFPSFKPDFDLLMKDVSDDKYKIILSHAPDYALSLPKAMFDLQVSGHTHGGQIFPFHILAKIENKFLAGLYKVDGMDLYVSRGAGYWGPPVRFLAPSEITLIKVKPSDEKPE